MNIPTPLCASLGKARLIIACAILCLLSLCAHSAVINLTLEQSGSPLAGQSVAAYKENGTYLGVTKTTSASGAASFDVSLATPVKFRLSRNGTFVWSNTTAIAGPFVFSAPADTVVTVLRNGAALGATTVYAYDEAGTYLNYSRTTDAAGVARFSFAAGARVKFRVDADGQQKYSAVQTSPATFTYTLPGTMTLTLTKGGVVQAGKTVYAYNAAGVYTNYSRTTDAAGIARFCIDEGSVVKFRADDGGIQFFSALATAPVATSLDLPADTVVTVMRDGAVLPSTTVYVYDEAGTYLNYSRATDANGVARFSIAAGTRVKFRVDADGQQKFSTVQTASVTFTYALPGTMTLTLTKGGVVQAGKTVYVYNSAGAYTNYSRTTDANGVARFCIDDGSVVKFRADDGGVQFFSGLATAPTAATLDLTPETVVTVMRNGTAQGNTTVYAYDETGNYLNYSRATDANGVARFSIAAGTRVKFRVDCDGQQKYSAVQTAPATFTYSLPGVTTLTLTKGGAMQAGQTVYVYDAAGVYTNYSRTTDVAGVARFCIDDGSVVKFRADDGGVQFFSGPSTVPTAAALDLPSDTVVTVMRNGAPLGNTTVYVYDEAGAYTNYSRATDAAGVVRFSLATGARVKFRVDADGQQNFSTVQTAPAAFTYGLPGLTTLTLTKGGAVQAGQTVYVYDAAGVYTNYSRTTDAAGVARFCIDDGSVVKFRADDGGVQFFSGLATVPTAAALDLPSDTVVTVMRNGAPSGNTTVYVYDEAGAYTNYSRATDASGVVRFSLATGARVKFRVDADGQQKFSTVQTAAVTFAFTLPGTTTLTLTKGGVVQAGKAVYVYNSAGSYTNYSRTTDASGVARFCIDEGSTVKFRADDGGVQYFSALQSTPATATLELLPQIAPLVFSVPAGNYAMPQNVAITTSTAGVTIHYTTNGIDPVESDPVLASGGTVLVDHNLTLKARAWATGLIPSDVGLATYTIGDDDNDLLLDAWEDQYLGTRSYGATDDPGNVGRTLLQSYQQGLSPWPVPTVSAGLRAWYRADVGIIKEASDKVSQWTDLSGSGFHVTQTADVARQPSFIAGAMNNQPALVFDGATMLKSPGFSDLQVGSSDVTVIAVVKPETTQGFAATIFSWGTDGNLSHGLITEGLLNQFQMHWADGNNGEVKSPRLYVLPGQVQLLEAVKNGTTATVFFNGTLQGTSTVPAAMAPMLSPVAIGNAASPYYGFNGQIAEILVYNRALSDTERQQIETSLKAKYVDPDADGDGLPDVWEDQHVGTRSYGATDDPGNVGRTLLQSYQQSGSPWPAPTVADGLRAWYRADVGVTKDASNKVSLWTDLSGSGFHVIQTAEMARRPLFVADAMNSQPAVVFDRSTVLQTPVITDLQVGSNDVTVIAVIKPEAPQGFSATIFYWGTDGNLTHGLITEGLLNQFQMHWADSNNAEVKSPRLNVLAGQIQLLGAVKSGTTSTVFINGTLQGTETVPATMAPMFSPVAMGNAVYPYYGFNGQIAEVLVYNRALSATERQQIETFLAAKYINPDADSDGLPDAWEDQQFGTRSYGATDDPGNVGRTLQQSYQLGLSPWPAPVVADGLRAWYRAGVGVIKDSNNKVSQWADLSGLGGHVAQTTVAKQPTQIDGAFSGQPAVQFDGAATALQSPKLVGLFNGSNDASVFVVFKPEGTQSFESGIFDSDMESFRIHQVGGMTNRYEVLWKGPDNNIYTGGTVDALAEDPQLYCVTKNDARLRGYINGLIQSDFTIGGNQAPDFKQDARSVTIGGFSNQLANFNGLIAEILIYNRSLSDTERQQVEDALAARYFNPDADGDGLPDAWEDRQLGTRSYGANDDPGSVGRTLLQSYQQSLRIWPAPTVANGLRAWYRADMGVVQGANNKVRRWSDLSGSDFNVVQTLTPALQPVLAAGTMNGQPAVRFDGMARLQTVGLTNLQLGSADVTVIAVVKPEAIQSDVSTILFWGTDQTFNHGLSSKWVPQNLNQYALEWAYPGGVASSPWITTPAGQVQVLSTSKSGAIASAYLNGALQANGLVPAEMSTTLFPLAVGNSAQPYYTGTGFNGQIAEVLIYNRALSLAERLQIETALINKYVNPDQDGDGLPDAWEDQKLGVRTYTANDDPGSVGRTLVQSYQQGLSPWPEPTVTTGLRAWFRADVGVVKDGSNRVRQWTDLSGNGVNVVQQPTATERPLWVDNALNGKPALQFDGFMQLETTATVDLYAGSNDFTAITVVIPDATQREWATLFTGSQNGAPAFSQEQSSNNRYSMFWREQTQTAGQSSPGINAAGGQIHLLSALKAGTNSQSFLDGQPQGSNTVEAIMWSSALRFAVGNTGWSPNFGYSGKIAEILIYNRALSMAERQQVELALTAKYALSTTPVPVISSPLSAVALVGQAFSYQITATNNPTSFAATGLPSGLAIDATTGLISGTPVSAGIANVLISAANAGGTGSATLTLTQNVQTNPVFTSATLRSGHFERGLPFEIVVVGDRIAAGNVTVDFLTASGGRTVTLPLAFVNGSWVASGATPVDVPLSGGPGASVSLSVAITLQSPSGEGTTANATLPLLNDTTAPSITVDQPTTATIDAATTTITGTVGSDTTGLKIAVGAAPGTAVTFDPANGRFSVTLTLQEGPNAFTLVARDFLGNQAQVALALTRTLRAPVVVFTTPVSFGDPVNTTTLRLAGTVADASAVQFTINGATVTLGAGGAFDLQQSLPNEGANTLLVVAEDFFHLKTTQTYTVYRITQGPALEITSPASDPFATRLASVTIAGTVGTSATQLLVNTTPVADFSTGSFSAPVSLVPGDNAIVVEARDALGNSRTLRRTITLDQTPPSITGLVPQSGFVTNTPNMIVSGRVVDGQSLTVNGTNISLAPTGTFSTTVALAEGASVITLETKDALGNAATVLLNGQLDTIAPVVTINAPLAGATLAAASINVTGVVDDPTATLTINSVVAVNTAGTFQASVPLNNGSNTITVQARDAAGNSASKSVTVSRDTTAPIVAFTAPANGSLTKSTTVRVAGTVDDALATVTVNGRSASVTGGVFEILGFALNEGQNTLAAVATDTLGNASAPISIVVTSDTIAPAKPSLTNPPAYVKADRVTLQGTAAPGAVVSLTGGLIAVSATADSAGAFSATVLLTPNTTTNLFIRATDAAGNASDPLVYTVVSDTIAPAITVTRPEEGASLSSSTVEIVGVVSEANLGPAISVNGEAVPLSSTGQFGAHVTLPNGPAQTIVITVVDLAGNQAQLTRTVSVDDAAGDDTPPSISVIDPVYDAVVPSPQVNVTALITDESPLDSITIGGHAVADADGDGLVTTSVTVDANGEFVLTAVDSHGLSNSVTHRVQVQSAPPPAPTIQRFSQEGSTSSSQVILYGAGQAGLRYEITGGLLAKQTGVVGADGKFVVTVQLTGNTTNHIQVVVIGPNGVASTATTSDLIQDSIAPTVVLTAPAASAEQVPLASTIQITFSEAIRAADIASVQVRAGANVVSSARTLSTDGTILTLTPSAPFGESANVQVTVPATVGDLAGNTLGSAYVFAFKTADLTAPATPVVDALPARTSNATLTVTGAAEALSKITVSGAAAALPVFADATGHFSLNITLQANTANTLLVTATDAAGNVSTPRTVSITHEDQSLVLLSSVPVASAVNVALNTAITVTFNKAVDPASLTGVTLAGQVIVPTTVVANAAILTLTPTAALENGKNYEIVVPATVADLFGNRLGTTRRIAFTTVQNAATPVPIVYSAQPEGVTNKVSATISGYSAPGTQLLVSGGNAPFTFPATGVIDGTGLFTVDVPLQPNAQNTITLTARNAQGQLSAAVTALNVRQDSIAPTIVSTTPLTGATNVDAHAALFVQFSEAIQSTPLTAAIPAIRLFDAQNVVVPGNWTLSPDARSVTFYPTRELAAEAHFKLLIGTTVRDLAGNPLGAATEVDFTTAASTQGNRPATPVLDPLASTKTTAPSITLTGSAPAGAQLRVYGGQANASALVDANGRFAVTVSLVLNSLNPLALVAEVGTDTSLPATITITQSKHAAGIRILSPQPNLEYNNRSITVAGVIDDPASVKSITVDGAPAAIAGRFFFHQVILDPTPGAKNVRAVATLQDNSTLEASASFTLLIEPADTDTKLPIPRFIFPEEGDSLNGEVVEALLTVEEGVQLTSVDIDHVVAHQVVGNIFFIYAHLPQQGANTITVNATDAAGLVGTSSVNVTMDSIGFPTAPTVDALPTLTNDRDITLTGTAEPGGTIVVMNGLVPVRTVVSPTGTYSVVVPLNPNAANHLTIFITDDVGNLSPVTTVDITHDDTPPTVVSTSPSAGQTGVPQNSPIEITFSEALNLATVSPDAAIVVRSTLGQSIQRSVNLSADGKTIRITPSFKFLRSDTIKVDISGSIADLHGFALGTDQSFTFNTVAGQTTLSGIVIDPLLRPLANVKVGIVGTNLVQTTSSFGTFLLDDAPVGDQILYVDARPDPLTGVSPQGDTRIFNYLEFLVPVRKGVDNGLGRPIFMVDTDFSTSSSLALTGENNLLTFTPATKDLTGFSITYKGGSARFGDGTTRGKLTATRIDAANIPDRLPSGAIPHFLVEIGPDDLTFDTPAKLGFPNAYNLAVGAEVIVFQFKYGVHNYTELGRAVVGANNRILTDPILSGAGFVGIVPADKSFDLTRTYLNGRVVDTAGKGLAGISVNAIAGSSYVVTDAAGNYSIPLPEVRIELIRTYATVTTDLGSRNGESPSLVFQSAMVNLSPSGVTKIPDIVVDSFFLGGSIRYVDAAGARIPVTGLAYSTDGRLVSVDNPTAHGVDIFVYRRISAVGAAPAYDSQPYMRTTAGLEHLDDTFDASFALSFLGSLAASSSQDPNLKSQIPVPGDVVKIVAFDRKTGFYAESDLKIPAASEAHGGSTPLDVLVNLELRPPAITLDMNRVFFLDGIRRRANIPHRGIAFTNDEYVEFKTTWTTPAAKPLDRPELALTGRLRVNSIDYQTDYGFVVRGGEHFRVLELREAVVPDRLTVLQRDTDVGIETISVSRDGTFVDSTLLPITVKTDSYGLAGAPVDVSETSSKNVELYILNLTLAQGTDGIDASGRFLPGKVINIGGNALSTDGKGFFGKHLTGSLGTGGIPVQADNSLATRFGEALTPVINLLDATPAGLVPSRGAQGNTVLINGAHFSPVATDNKVDFNGAIAIVQSASETQLSVIVPDLASSGDVSVTIAGKKSNGVHFEFLSVGINNGSFEDGTLRAFTLTGSGQVVERWKAVTPTDRQFMAFLDTMSDPRDGRSTLTTDPFEVPAGMQTLLFDYNFTATALLHPVTDVLEFYIVTDTEAIKVDDLFSAVTLEDYSPLSGFEQGSGFRTGGVLVSAWAGTGKRIQVKVVLKGRGVLPDIIPGMNANDANPLGFGDNAGTGLFLDNFRLSNSYQPPLAPIEPTAISITSDGTAATITGTVGAVPSGSRVYISEMLSGIVHQIDVGADGQFTLTIPFPEDDSSAYFLISYGTAAGTSGRVFSPTIKLGVDR